MKTKKSKQIRTLRALLCIFEPLSFDFHKYVYLSN